MGSDNRGQMTAQRRSRSHGALRAAGGQVASSLSISEALEARKKKHPTAEDMTLRRLAPQKEPLSTAAYSVLHGQLDSKLVGPLLSRFSSKSATEPLPAPGAALGATRKDLPNNLETAIETLVLKVGAPRQTVRGRAAASVPILPPRYVQQPAAARPAMELRPRRELKVMLRHHVLTMEDKRVNAAKALERDLDGVKRTLEEEAMRSERNASLADDPDSEVPEEMHVFKPFPNLTRFIPAGCMGWDLTFPNVIPHSYLPPVEFSRLSNAEYNQALEVCLGYAALAASGRSGSHVVLTRPAVCRLFVSLQRSSPIGIFSLQTSLHRFDSIVKAQQEHSPCTTVDGVRGLLLEPRVEDASWCNALELFVLGVLEAEASRDTRGIMAAIDDVREDFFNRRLRLSHDELRCRVEQLEDWGKAVASTEHASNGVAQNAEDKSAAEELDATARPRDNSEKAGSKQRSALVRRASVASRRPSVAPGIDDADFAAPSRQTSKEKAELDDNPASLKFILRRKHTFKVRRSPSTESEQMGTHVSPGHNLYIRTVTLAKGELLSSALSQPEAMHITWMYHPLFQACFCAYFDVPTFGSGEEGQGHMSLRAFLRFCTDFGIFPHLVDYASLLVYYNFCASALSVPSPPRRRRKPFARKGFFQAGDTLEVTQAFSYQCQHDGSLEFSRVGELVRLIETVATGSKDCVVVNEQGIRFNCKSGCLVKSSKEFHLIKLTDVRRRHDREKIEWINNDYQDMSEEQFSSLFYLSLIDDHLADRALRSQDLFGMICPPGHIRLGAEDILAALESFGMDEQYSIEEMNAMLDLICPYPGREIDIEDFEAVIHEVRERKARRRKSGNFLLKDHFDLTGTEACAHRFLFDLDRVFSASGWKPEVFMRRFAPKQAAARRRSDEAGVPHTCAADLVEVGFQIGLDLQEYHGGREGLVHSLEVLTALDKPDALTWDDLEQIFKQVQRARQMRQKGPHGAGNPFLLSPVFAVPSVAGRGEPQLPTAPGSPRSRRPSASAADIRGAWEQGNDALVFGVKAFMECVFKVGLGFLIFHGTDSQTALPVHLKLAWLMGYLNLNYSKHVSKRQQQGLQRRRSSGLQDFDLLHREDIPPLSKLLHRRPELFQEEPSQPPKLGTDDYSRTERCRSCGKLPLLGWGHAACSTCGLGDTAQRACLTDDCQAESYPLLHRLVAEWPTAEEAEEAANDKGDKPSAAVSFSMNE